MDASQVASVGVNRDTCQAAATCLAYQVYELDDESKAVLLTRNGSNSDESDNPLATAEGFVRIEDLLNDQRVSRETMQALVLESAQACPFNAIIVKDADGNQIWPQE
ncbi:ferredoxin [Patescibacteria group bacterium]|nr:ferredoxin [Patescibacteria group bacterium]